MRRCSGMILTTEPPDPFLRNDDRRSKSVNHKHERSLANARLFSWLGLVDVFQEECIYTKNVLLDIEVQAIGTLYFFLPFSWFAERIDAPNNALAMSIEINPRIWNRISSPRLVISVVPRKRNANPAMRRFVCLILLKESFIRILSHISKTLRYSKVLKLGWV